MTAPKHPNAFAAYDLVRGVLQAAHMRWGYAGTASLAVPATIFRALGGFDARRFSGGDAECCRRAGSAGHRLAAVAIRQRVWAAEVAETTRLLAGGAPVRR